MPSAQQSKTQLKGVVALLFAALIWGSSFVAQSIGMESIDAFTFTAVRSLLGGTALLPVIFLSRGRAGGSEKHAGTSGYPIASASDTSIHPAQGFRKQLLFSAVPEIKYGVLLGIVFSLAQNFQQFAFYWSTSGKIGFITAFYMFFVPLIGIFLRKKIPFLTWVSVFGGIVGLYFLSFAGGGLEGVNRGDLLALCASVFYAIHILMIEKLAPEADGILLSCVQFFTGGILSTVLMLLFEHPQLSQIRLAILPLLYSGVVCCGVAYTLQIIGQKYCEATAASLLMCAESVFAVIFGAIILHERMTGRELLGCAIMFCSILLSQVPGDKKRAVS